MNEVIDLQTCGCEPGTGVAGHKNDRCNARLGKDHICHDRGVSTACRGWPGGGWECVGQNILKTATEVKILPTPASPGDLITWQGLQVTIDQLEITADFITEFGSRRIPSPGKKFMWAHIQLKNVGQIEIEIPQIEHFSVLYAATEIKPTYGHRQGYAEYSTLGPILFPDQEADGWIRFDIPAAAELKDMLCVFIPESAQIGTTFSSPNYPYSETKPTYVWKCSS